ncbi:MAG: outer membrane lipoprotein carrier protein LolA [Deltaproteobacteria bacterium]|jgi:outer membrane lipoprotein-sorting protein|nr:outer membrane lipoprotein carrier protein LolA [Deltaproteobacteria bacterium]
MRRARSGLAILLPIVWLICNVDALAAGASEPAPGDLEALMRRFAESGGVRARFRESRQLSILTDPIETQGMLYFAPPDRLARHTSWPGRSSIVIEADRVSISDETGQRVFDLDTSEVARALVGNLMVVFRGDLEALRERYSISFESAAESWTLDLEPRSRALRSVIERVHFAGEGQNLLAMETREPNGDRTVVKFSEIEVGVSWQQRDLDEIFSIDPPDTAP